MTTTKVAQAPPKKAATPPNLPPTPPSPVTVRIDTALKQHAKINRSSELVVLQRDFQSFRKKLKDLTVALKNYPMTLTLADQARVQILDKLVVLTKKSPIEKSVAGAGRDSMTTVSGELSRLVKDSESLYKNKIIKYAVEWESVVTARVDKAVESNDKLHAKLEHYTTKVEGLRKRTNKVIEVEQAKSEKKNEEKKGAMATPAVPQRLRAKLERNESKLSNAWQLYERSASELCNLLEEATAHGWNDLHPLLLDLIQWEVERTTAKYDVVAELIAISENLSSTFEIEQQKHVRDLQEGKLEADEMGSVASLPSEATSDSNE